MKRIVKHPPKSQTGRQYWRSLEEQADTPEFNQWLEREFPAGAAEMEVDGLSRRNFLQLMGASVALAGFGVGCKRPELFTTPFTKSVEWSIPGKPIYYATSMPSRRGSMPLVATTNEGRPTKIEGNPLHPTSNGATNQFAQASVLDLWDPDRANQFVTDGKASTAEDFDKYFSGLLQSMEGSGEGLAFLVEENNSPTTNRLVGEVRKRFPQAAWCVYEPMGEDSQVQAVEAAFGKGVSLDYKLGEADVVLSLGADFLGAEDGTVTISRDFSARRRVHTAKDEMNRLYVVESQYSITGGMADHRLRLKTSALEAFAAAVGKKVAQITGDGALQQVCAGVTAKGEFDQKWIDGVAQDLANAGDKAMVIGGMLQSPALQGIALAMNSALGAIGKSVALVKREKAEGISFAELAKNIASGTVKTLVISGGNPAFNSPADFDFAKQLAKVPDVIRLGLWEDETSELSKWHVPAAHYLESWGDGVAPDGSYVPVQPMILPLYGGWSLNEVLAKIAGLEDFTGMSLVRETFDSIATGSDKDAAWTSFLQDGMLDEPTPTAESRSLDSGAIASLVGDTAAKEIPSGLELVFVLDNKVEDGRYVNNGWMQELPDPVTKLTWDNAALMSPATAEKLGVVYDKSDADITKTGSYLIELKVGGRSLEVPALIAPGHADDSITLPVGYGRERVGRVGFKTGFNAYSLRTSDAMRVATNVAAANTGRKYLLAVTHGHWLMEDRHPVREARIDDYKMKPDFPYDIGMDSHIPPDKSLYDTPPLTAEEQWAMSIDLNTCTGCNACVIACQSENNIPIVGKEQVILQREMHWIRIDRYYSTVDEHDPDPEMVMQPMACQHCENAPCETVCPVNATVHSPDGLNVMAYNRCIGTRYCANNCPYKVRRFNFFDYNKRDVLKDSKIFPKAGMPLEGIHGNAVFDDGRSNLYDGPFGDKGSPDTIKMQKNPNVTVRMRGVIEKCTFCLQRIEEGRIKSKIIAGGSDNDNIPANSIKTACQQACPSESIIFGDKNNADSDVTKLIALDHNYVVLKYLNVRPRISYLARLRNPNMAMPGADKVGMINHMGGHGDGHDADGDAHDTHGGVKEEAHH